MTLWHFWRTHAAEFASLFGQHVLLVGISTLVAIAAGVPIGILAARRPRAGAPIVWLANVVQTIPSLAMFGFLLPLPLVGGLGARVAIFVLILYALLPIVRTTAAGLRSVDRVLVEAGTAMGMTPWQLLRDVELPLALPSIVAGIRVAAVIGVGTATIAAAVGAGGLGEYIFRGLSMVDPTVILAGAIPSAVLALTIDGALTALERVLKTRQRPSRRRAPAWLLVPGRAADRGRADRGVRAEGWHERHPRRVEELHRADHPRRADRAGHRGARTAGRAPPEPRRHVHLRSRAALGGHRHLRRVLRDRADRDLPSAGRYRFTPGARERQGALRRSGADAARSARVREHVRHAGPGRRRQTARPAHHLRSGGPRPRRGGRASATSSCSARTAIRAWRGRTASGLPRHRPRWTCRSSIARSPSARSISSPGTPRAASSPPTAWSCSKTIGTTSRPTTPRPSPGAPVLLAHPEVREALTALSGRITVADMRRMNHAVDAEHRDPADVAREFLV